MGTRCPSPPFGSLEMVAPASYPSPYSSFDGNLSGAQAACFDDYNDASAAFPDCGTWGPSNPYMDLSPYPSAIQTQFANASSSDMAGSNSGCETPAGSPGSHSPQEELKEKRRERRRAQNRAAQRAFRARKEDAIKEISEKLQALQREFERIEQSNDDYAELIPSLRREIGRLERENEALKAASPGPTIFSESPCSSPVSHRGSIPFVSRKPSEAEDAAAMANGLF